MAFYPFDTQQCSVILSNKGNSGKFIKLVKDKLEYLGPIDLTQYFVKDTQMSDYRVPPDNPAVRVDIIFGRRILAPILTTYLPTILLCLVSFSTNYFKAFFFEAIVTVNLTALLVLTTLFISVSDSLPKTSYIKMIDIWLIFNLFIPFAEVLLHTFIDSLREEESREVNHHGSSVKTNNNPSDKVIKVHGKTLKSGNAVRPLNLISRIEEEELQARKNYYEKTKITNEKRMKVAIKVASQGLPFIFVAFTVCYFAVGLIYYHGA